MITEKGTLVVGVEYEGKVHKEFELRPQLVRDSVEALEGEHAERAKNNDSFFGVCLLTKQTVKIGDIPKEHITPVLIMSLTEIDFQIVSRAREALEKRLRSFRSETEKPQKANTGTP
jgi:phage FluMu protein gp41